MSQGIGPIQAASNAAAQMGATAPVIQAAMAAAVGMTQQQTANQIALQQQQQALLGMNAQQQQQLQQIAAASGMTIQQLLGGAPQQIATVPESPDQAILIVGEYIVERNSRFYYSLCHHERGPLVTWIHFPSRSAVAAAIRDDRARRPRKNARDAFGTLIGVRLYALTVDLHLMSPAQATVWNTNVLVAERWDESDAVRGTCGIHAAWPCVSPRVMPFIDTVNRGPNRVIACVRGMDRFVAGETGWRAERVIVDKVFLPSYIKHRWRYLKRLERLYPEVEFEEEPWTLERSQRSAR
jgi:hypothetical protein